MQVNGHGSKTHETGNETSQLQSYGWPCTNLRPETLLCSAQPRHPRLPSCRPASRNRLRIQAHQRENMTQKHLPLRGHIGQVVTPTNSRKVRGTCITVAHFAAIISMIAPATVFWRPTATAYHKTSAAGGFLGSAPKANMRKAIIENTFFQCPAGAARRFVR